MRFQVLDGGAGNTPPPPPPPRETPFGLINLPWLAERAQSERALSEVGPGTDLTTLRALYDQGQVCSRLCTMMALRTEPGEKAEALLHEALREGAMEMLAGFIGDSLGMLGTLGHAEPYLTALASMANYAALQGDADRAIEYWQLLFMLDHDDTMVVRGALMGTLVLAGRVEEALALWSDWRGDSLPSLAWLLPLAHAITGDQKRAESALALAREGLASAEPYLTGQTPDFEPGSTEMVVWVDAAHAWAAHEDAARWLASRPRREPTDADYATLGLVKPPPGVNSSLAQHLDAIELKRLAGVCKGILKFEGRMPQDHIEMALTFANEMAEVSDSFYEGALKTWVAGLVWLVNNALGGKLTLPRLATEFKVSAQLITQRATEVAIELRSQRDDDDVDWDHDPFDLVN